MLAALFEVSNLLHLAIGKGKLAAWEDCWRPKDVVDSLEAQRQERIQERVSKQGVTSRLESNAKMW